MKQMSQPWGEGAAKGMVGKLVFPHLLKPVFSCTYTWNKSPHSLEQTLLEFIVLYVMHGEPRWTMENRRANHSTIMPVAGTGWLDLESLWFGFEEQWLNDISYSQHSRILFL